MKSAPAAASLHPWLWPERPRQRIHIDFAGSFKGMMFILCMDAHSKWLKIVDMSSTTNDHTIKVLQQMFAAFGLPEQLVSDNGTQFIT